MIVPQSEADFSIILENEDADQANRWIRHQREQAEWCHHSYCSCKECFSRVYWQQGEAGAMRWLRRVEEFGVQCERRQAEEHRLICALRDVLTPAGQARAEQRRAARRSDQQAAARWAAWRDRIRQAYLEYGPGDTNVVATSDPVADLRTLVGKFSFSPGFPYCDPEGHCEIDFIVRREGRLYNVYAPGCEHGAEKTGCGGACHDQGQVAQVLVSRGAALKDFLRRHNAHRMEMLPGRLRWSEAETPGDAYQGVLTAAFWPVVIAARHGRLELGTILPRAIGWRRVLELEQHPDLAGVLMDIAENGGFDGGFADLMTICGRPGASYNTIRPLLEDARAQLEDAGVWAGRVEGRARHGGGSRWIVRKISPSAGA